MSSSLQRKVHGILSSRTQLTSPEMLSAMKQLHQVFPLDQNTVANRRLLMDSLEVREVEAYKQLLRSFAKVDEKLQTVEGEVDQLNATCQAVTSRLESVREQTSELISKTVRLQSDKEKLEDRRNFVLHFLEQFQLSPEEESILQAGVLSPEYFQVLGKMTTLRKRCEELISGIEYQRAGLDIVETLATKMETGYERVYAFLLDEEHAGMYAQTDPNAILVGAFQLLRKTPVYFVHCCEELCRRRRVALAARFLQALSRGGPDGNPRPIELYAHDAVRYVGNILAWIHQAVAGEIEFLAALGFTEEPQEEEEEVKKEEDVKEEQEEPKPDWSRSSVLSQVFQGVARSLEMRVEQALEASPSELVLYKVGNTSLFYITMLAGKFQEDSSMLETLRGIAKKSLSLFLKRVRADGQHIARSPPPYNHDLSVCRGFQDRIRQLSQVIAVFASSYPSDDTVPSSSSSSSASTESKAASELRLLQRDCSVVNILQMFVEPILEGTKLSVRHVGVGMQLVYRMNVLDAVRVALSSFSDLTSVSTRVETLSFDLDSLVAEFVNTQTETLMASFSLERIYPRFSSASNGAQELEKEDAKVVCEGVRLMYERLVQLGIFALPQCDPIVNNVLRRKCQSQVATNVSTFYTNLYAAVFSSSSPSQGSAAAECQHAMTRSPEQINTLLGLAATSISAAQA